MGKQVKELIDKHENVMFSRIVINGILNYGDKQDIEDYRDLSEAVKLAGSPVTLIMGYIYDMGDLPEGAITHIVTAKEEVKGKLEKLFKDYEDVFPPKLPMEIPPNRGLGDEHKIAVEKDSKPPAKSAYR